MASPLTLDLLQQRLTKVSEFYLQRNENMLYWRDLYFRSPKQVWKDDAGVYIEPEPDEERLVLPIPQEVVEGFRELLLTKSPVISVPPPTAAGMELIAAEHNEKALQVVWNRAEIAERLRDSLWHGLVDGWGVLQLAWDKDASEFESPVYVTHQDPYNVYAMPGDRPDSWKYVIHCYPRLVGTIRDEWDSLEGVHGNSKEAKTLKSAFDGLEETDEVTFIDYWDDKINAVAINFNTKVKGSGETTIESRWIKAPTPHNYGFLPWEIYMPCRLPFRTVGERMGISVLYPIEDLVIQKDKIISQKATMLSRWQDPPLVTQTELGPSFEPVRTERGMHLRLGLDEKASYLVHPGPMPQIDSLLEQVTGQIETSALPRALQGQYEGAISGVAMSLLRNPTLMKVAFRQKEVERCMERLNSKILRLLEKKLTRPLYLWGKTSSAASIDTMIDPTKIAGYYRNEVKLSASLPTDDAATVSMLMTMVQMNILSRQTARDVAQQTLHDLVPQSLIDEEERVLAELIWQNPGIIEALAQAAAKKVNLPYLPKQENPKGGYGDKEVAMPAQALASQTPGLPGGNTKPDANQSRSEMLQQSMSGGGSPPMAQR